jgi:hypothetical protein
MPTAIVGLLIFVLGESLLFTRSSITMSNFDADRIVVA